MANAFVAEGRVLESIYMGLIRLGHKLELYRIVVSPIGAEVRKVVSRVRPRVQERLEAEGFWSKARENVKRMSGNGIWEVGDGGEAVPHIGSLIRGCVGRQGGMRKSRGRIRT